MFREVDLRCGHTARVSFEIRQNRVAVDGEKAGYGNPEDIIMGKFGKFPTAPCDFLLAW